MKKIVAFISAFLYLSLTSGLAVNIHYCMGKIADVDFHSYNEPVCKCGEAAKMPCCNQNFELLKVSDEHQQVDGSINCKAPEIQIQTRTNLVSLIAGNGLFNVPEINSPLLLLSPPDIYIQNCVFRI